MIRYNHVAKMQRPCTICEKVFFSHRRNVVCCSKACSRIYNRKKSAMYAVVHREKIRERVKRRKSEDPEKSIEARRRCYQKRKEKIVVRGRTITEIRNVLINVEKRVSDLEALFNSDRDK